jgi:hypothetical protein
MIVKWLMITKFTGVVLRPLNDSWKTDLPKIMLAPRKHHSPDQTHLKLFVALARFRIYAGIILQYFTFP